MSERRCSCGLKVLPAGKATKDHGPARCRKPLRLRASEWARVDRLAESRPEALRRLIEAGTEGPTENPAPGQDPVVQRTAFLRPEEVRVLEAWAGPGGSLSAGLRRLQRRVCEEKS